MSYHVQSRCFILSFFFPLLICVEERATGNHTTITIKLRKIGNSKSKVSHVGSQISGEMFRKNICSSKLELHQLEPRADLVGKKKATISFESSH
jgi:hypothetical protein